MITGNLGKAGGGLAFLAPKANTLGAWELGAVQPGNPELLALLETGKLKGLFLIAEDPAGRSHCSPDQAAALKASGIFLVVQDLFLSEAAEQADLVLPALPYSEKMGTFTNVERRVQLLKPSIPPSPGTLWTGDLLHQLAARMGTSWPRMTPEQTLEEIARELPGLGRIDPAPTGTRRSAVALSAAGPPRDPHFIYGGISRRIGPPGVHLKGVLPQVRAGDRSAAIF